MKKKAIKEHLSDIKLELNFIQHHVSSHKNSEAIMLLGKLRREIDRLITLEVDDER